MNWDNGLPAMLISGSKHMEPPYRSLELSLKRISKSMGPA